MNEQKVPFRRPELKADAEDLFLPWTGGDTSQVQPPVDPNTLGSQNRTVPIQTGAVWTSPRALGANARAGRRGRLGRCSHHRTRRSDTGGTASVSIPITLCTRFHLFVCH